MGAAKTKGRFFLEPAVVLSAPLELKLETPA
jgi:hypothetical protein